MAHKKAAGSAKNLRDSNPKYRGLKIAGWQFARAWNIIVRQKGDKYQLGLNVYKGSDFTIHASLDGIVSFRKKKFLRYDGRRYLRTVVDVFPQGQGLVEKKTKTRSVTTKAWSQKKSDDKITVKETKKVKEAEKIPAKKTSAKATKGDDLTKIEGIGPKIQDALYAAGILSYADLSGSKIGDLRKILADNELSQHDPKTWKKQATLAKNEKRDDLEKLQEELNAGK